jgi:hypothetical protein
MSDDRGTGRDEPETAEQKIARRLLERREKGIHPWRALIPRYPASAISIFLCVVLVVFALTNELEKTSLALICLFIGAVLGKQFRDYAWVRDIAKTFRVTRNFIDWKIVKAAARGEGRERAAQDGEQRDASRCRE